MNGIVGLTGYARSGKDTVADVLVEEFGYVKLPFAGPLKAMARRINPIIGHELGTTEVHTAQSRAEGKPLRVAMNVQSVRLLDVIDTLGEDETKSRYPEYRRFLQYLGTNGIRHVADDFWITQWWAEAHELLENGKSIVVPDVRFPNEAEAIRDLGPVTGEAPRGIVARVARRDLESSDAHESEKHVGKMQETPVIRNDGKLWDLKVAAHALGTALTWV